MLSKYDQLNRLFVPINIAATEQPHFVQQIEGKDLKYALNFIKDCPKTDLNHHVVLFKNVIKPIPNESTGEIESIIKQVTSQRQFKEIQLTEIDNEQIFVQLNVELEEPQNFEDINDRLQEDQPTFDAEDVNEYHDNCIKFIAETSNILYTTNVDRDTVGIESKLAKFPININPNVDQLEEANQGLNVPTYYFGTSMSVTSIHCEDGYLDAINLLLYGRENGFKIWLIIHPFYSAFVNALIGIRLNEIRNEMKNKKSSKQKKDAVKKWEPNCPLPLHHKSLILTTEFLNKHNIRYQIVLQHPGDLIYLQPGVYHQVLNNNINLSEEINVGSIPRHISASLFTTCLCKDSSLSWIIPSLNKEDNIIHTHEGALSGRTISYRTGELNLDSIKTEDIFEHPSHDVNTVGRLVQPNDREMILDTNNSVLIDNNHNNDGTIDYEYVDGTLDKISPQIAELQESVNSLTGLVLSLMESNAKLNTRMEYMIKIVEQGEIYTEKNDNIGLSLSEVKLIDSVEELIELESKLSKAAFFKDFGSKFYTICGRNSGVKGPNVCYILIDAIFTRRLFTLVSWTGASRTSENPKENFSRLVNIFKFIFLLVKRSDPNFTEHELKSFFQRIIDNSRRRFESTLGSAPRRASASKIRSVNNALKKRKIDINDHKNQKSTKDENSANHDDKKNKKKLNERISNQCNENKQNGSLHDIYPNGKTGKRKEAYFSDITEDDNTTDNLMTPSPKTVDDKYISESEMESG